MRQNDFQLSLHIPRSKKIFGGSLLKKSNPKKPRPLSMKHPMHFVLKSVRAKGKYSFLQKSNAKKIDFILKKQAKKFGIKIYRYENVGNHLHILLRGLHRRLLVNYIRSVTGLIPRAILGVERGRKLSLKFWDQRPFSRVVQWGGDYKNMLKYLGKNRLQALGFDLKALAETFPQANLDSG